MSWFYRFTLVFPVEAVLIYAAVTAVNRLVVPMSHPLTTASKLNLKVCGQLNKSQ